MDDRCRAEVLPSTRDRRWHAIDTGDFNGDGKADILWQNDDGTPAVWLMDGLNILGGANVGFNPGPTGTR